MESKWARSTEVVDEDEDDEMVVGWLCMDVNIGKYWCRVWLSNGWRWKEYIDGWLIICEWKMDMWRVVMWKSI